MDTNLRNFLSGRTGATELLEYNHLSPGSLSDLVNVNRTSRQARLGQTWQDFIIQLEALWLDVIDEDPEVYEMAEPSLQEIRNTPPEGCRAAVTAVQNLINVLAKAAQTDPDLEIMVHRMTHLSSELTYICDVFDPEKPVLPGAPVQTKKEWDKANAKRALGQDVGAADMTYAVDQGLDTPDGPDKVVKAKGEEEEGIPGQEEVPAPTPDEHPEDPVAAKDKMVPQIGAVATDVPSQDQPPTDEEPEEPGQEPSTDEEPEEKPEEPENDQGQEPEPGSIKTVPGLSQEPDTGREEPDDGGDGDKPDREGEEAPEDSDGADERDPRKKDSDSEGDRKNKRKPPFQKESIAAATSSLILASLFQANRSISEGESEAEANSLEAAQALEVAMEEFSDVSSALVEVGLTFPGNPPRLDLFVEWVLTEKGLSPSEFWKSKKGKKGRKKGKTPWGSDVKENFRPSDCYGYVRLFMNEATLEVYDANDNLRDSIEMTESLRDQEVVDRVYACLTIAHDVHPRRVFSESRVIPALYRLMDRISTGESISESAFAQLLTSLRTRLGLAEEVRMVAAEIGLKLEEGFEDTYNYYFSWAVRSPMTHGKLPDEISVDTIKDAPPPPDEDQEYEILDKEPYVGGAPKRDFDKDVELDLIQHHYGEHTEHWRTPAIGINLREKSVYITHAGGKREKLDRKKTDEDIAARLASMAYQKEGVEEGHIIEINRRDKCRVVENRVGSLLEYDLDSMDTEELWDLAVEFGLKIPGDGVTWDRDKLIGALQPFSQTLGSLGFLGTNRD